MNKRLKEIEDRMAQIRGEAQLEGADIDALDKELDELIEERKTILDKEESRKSLMNKVIQNGNTVRAFSKDEGETEETFDYSSPEYRTAFLKKIAVRQQADGTIIPMLGELTEREKRAFTFTTQNSSAVVPKATANKIVELVKSSSALYSDLNINRFSMPYSVARHIAIEEGDAAKLNEDAVPAEEKDTFDKIDIVGVDFKKGAKISQNMMIQSLDAFEMWLVNHIVKRLIHAANGYIYTVLDDTVKGMKAAQKFTTKAGLTDNELLKYLGAVTGGNVRIYANRKTIFSYLATIREGETSNKQLFFMANEDPLVRGIIHGAMVKEEASLKDNIMYIGAPEEIEANEFEEANVVAMPEKGRMTWFDGFMKFDCGLLDPEAFAKVTITPAA